MEQPQSLSSLKREYRKAKVEYKQAKTELARLNREEARLKCEHADIEVVLGYLKSHATTGTELPKEKPAMWAYLREHRGSTREKLQGYTTQAIESLSRHLRATTDEKMLTTGTETQKNLQGWAKVLKKAKEIRVKSETLGQFLPRNFKSIWDEEAQWFLDEIHFPFSECIIEPSGPLDLRLASDNGEVFIDLSIAGIILVEEFSVYDKWIELISSWGSIRLVQQNEEWFAADCGRDACPQRQDSHCKIITDGAYENGCPTSSIGSYLLNFVTLFLTFLNARNIHLEYIEPETPTGARKRHGKRILGNYYIVYMEPDKALRTASEGTGEGPRHGHIYDVRGHFRRLTDERYWRHSDGAIQVIWVRPHLRGLLSGGPYIPSIRRVRSKRGG